MFPKGHAQLRGAETKDDVRHMRYRLIVQTEFVWKSDKKPLTRVVVPEGFVTDGGSVPRFFWRVLGGPNGPYREGYLAHDLVYSQAGISQSGEKPTTRWQADLMLLEILLEMGARRWQARVIWFGLWLGGWVAWNKHKKRNAAAIEDSV